jgi:glutamate racemase
MAHIGIFDTGFGGTYVAQQLAKLRPHDTFAVADDRDHLPYGDRSDHEIIQLTDEAIQPLLDSNCDVIVIACNTATTIGIASLREKYPEQLFVGFEPMIKTAARETKADQIAILATPATLRSQRYRKLKDEWANGIQVSEPDCSDWAPLIERGAFSTDTATTLALELVEEGIDVISLACTHYLYLQEAMQEIVGDYATILSPLHAVNQQIDRVVQDS